MIHVHISDSTQEEDCLPVGSGDAHLKALLGALQGKGFAGCVLQELYRSSYQEEQEVREGYHRLQQMIDGLYHLSAKIDKIRQMIREIN